MLDFVPASGISCGPELGSESKMRPTEVVISLLRNGSTKTVCDSLLTGVQGRYPNGDMPTSIEELARAFGMTARSQDIVANGGLARIGHNWEIVVNANLPVHLQRFTVAHEIGHWVLLERFGIDEAVANSTGCFASMEAVCDRFAAMLLVPPEILLKALLAGTRAVKIVDLDRLAKRLVVPFRALFPALAASGVLQKSRQCILAFRPTSSSGGTAVGLHLWNAACPDGVVLAIGVRAEDIGLRQIDQCWHEMAAGMEIMLREPVQMTAGTLQPDPFHAGPVPRAAAGRPSVEVAYKLYRNPDEGVFIVGVLSLPVTN
jgi:IrrE N-terminal-like domain